MISLVVCLGLFGLVMLLYVPRTDMVPITSFAGADQSEVVTRLTAEGINVTAKSGQIYVPSNQRLEALSILQSSELLTEDTSIAFDELLKNASPWDSNEKNRQAYMIALQKTLSKIAGQKVTAVCGKINAKNSYGGYTGEKLFLAEKRDDENWRAYSDSLGTIMCSSSGFDVTVGGDFID